MTRLGRQFFNRDAVIVARELLGKVLVVGECSGRIVETEAYRPDDPASHSFRGETPRNRVMFGDPGHLYVYFTYGMHHCANVVTGPRGDGSAVLIRAVEPVKGMDRMRERRAAARRDADLTNGPAKVCQAFALDLADNGIDLVTAASHRIVSEGGASLRPTGVSPRVGISVGRDRHWRFFVTDSAYIGKAPRYEADSSHRGRRTPAP